MRENTKNVLLKDYWKEQLLRVDNGTYHDDIFVGIKPKTPCTHDKGISVEEYEKHKLMDFCKSKGIDLENGLLVDGKWNDKLIHGITLKEMNLNNGNDPDTLKTPILEKGDNK